MRTARIIEGLVESCQEPNLEQEFSGLEVDVRDAELVRVSNIVVLVVLEFYLVGLGIAG